MQRTLESLIREHVPLGKPGGTGFYALKCPVCNDYKERGGFKFESGEIGYHCFNCAHAARYTGGERISKKMRQVLDAFHIPSEEYEIVVNGLRLQKKEESSEITLKQIQKVNLTAPVQPLPARSYLLGETDEGKELQQDIVAYLIGRKIDPQNYPFYFSLDPYLARRVIIPYLRAGKLIYWQARAIDATLEPRFLNCSAPREAVMFNTDQLYTWTDLPLFVSEGVFNALNVNGVALLGSYLNEAKTALLKKSKRRLIFVIDKDGTGKVLGEKAIANGWEITFAPAGAKDINDSVQEYGLIYTVYALMNNVVGDPFRAQLAMNVRCTKSRRKTQ